MAGRSSTIRVSRTTHDTLAAQARARGISMAALLAEIADERHREAIWRSELEASRLDAHNPDVRTETGDWASADEDGVD